MSFKNENLRLFDLLIDLINRIVIKLDSLIKYLIHDKMETDSIDVLMNDRESGRSSIDEIIRKIDAARENLNDAILASDELRTQADTKSVI